MNASPKFCKHCGTALPPEAQFCRGCGQPIEIVAPPPARVTAPPSQVNRPVPRPKRRRGGCCLGCLGVLLVLALGVGALFFWWANRPSDLIALGSREKVSPRRMVSAEGVLTVNDPGSPINGLSIEVPEGAYEKDPPFKLSTRTIKNHQFGPGFNPITPLIHVDNGGAFAAEAMTVSVPIQISPDEFALAFFYDEKTGELEGIPLLELTGDKITLLTSHFSDFVITKIPFAELADPNVDTGFAPGVDDWQFVNEGSSIAPGGHCSGQTLTAMWYYYEKFLGAGERRLYGRYDNNNYGFSTIDFQQDDSWGQRWASVVQVDQWDKGLAFYRLWGLTSDALTWYSFAYAMKLTGEPQYVSIGRYVPEQDAQGQTKDVRKGHALVAYKIEGNRLWVADPNYPGETNRYISFENGAFQPYASGDNARDIAANGVHVYPEIHYIAKTAMVDWNKIGVQYQRVLEGKAAEGFFPEHIDSYLVEINPTTGTYVWSPLTEVLELDEADTVKAGEAYRGKLHVALTMAAGQDFQVTLYHGTQKIETKRRVEERGAQFDIPLEVGINELGFLIENIKHNEANYTDFKRVRVIYELPDLSGTWEGTWQVEQAFNAQRYIEDALVWALINTGAVESEAKAREYVAAAIETAPNLYNERSITMVLTALDPEKLDRYRVEVYQLADDGSTVVYNGEATFKEGVFSLNTDQGSDGTKFSFSGTLAGKDTLSGEFSVTAWLVVKDAVIGSWHLERQE